MKVNLLVFILILITSITLTKSQSNRVREDYGKECDAESECLLSTECEYYQDQQDVLKSLSKGKTRNALIRKLRNTICNVGKRAVCCPKPSLNDSNCGWPKRVPSNIVCAQTDCSTDPGEFPFSALIGRKVKKNRGFLPGGRPIIQEESEWFCSGVLLNKQFVLTAAHCKTEEKILKLRLGVHELARYAADDESQYQNFDISSGNFVSHEDYERKEPTSRGEKPTIRNDIALIKLPRDAEFNQFVQPSCWESQQSINDKLTVVGWGKTNKYQVSQTINGVYSNEQRALEVPVVNTNDCKNDYGFNVDKTHLCAGGNSGEDSCSGDSGGGLFSNILEGKAGVENDGRVKNDRWEVVGIVSYGSSRCGDGNPGIYTRVSQYIQWIKQTMSRMR